MNKTHGDNLDANENTALISFSDSPKNILKTVDNCRLMNIAFDSFAIALTNIVFPVPGGPYNKIPFGNDNKR